MVYYIYNRKGVGKLPTTYMRVIMNVLRFQLPIWVIMPLLGFTLFFGLGGGFITAQLFTPNTNCPESSEVCADFGVFWQVWDIASERFVDPQAVNPQRMIEGAINGMLDSLGDEGHTRFLSAEEAARWQEALSGEFEGIGAYIDVREGQSLIVAPIEGSPAEKAGLKAGDIILEVNGESTDGWDVERLSAQIRGPRDTQVRLLIQRAGEAEPFEVTITRQSIEVPNVSWRMLPDNVAMIRLNSFGERSAAEMQQALTEAQNAGARALILDLRYNPGGLLNEAIAIASEFLPPNTPVLLEEDREGNRSSTETRGEGVARDIPMVVLVNGSSASSAEILSGALQDAGRAQIIGETTIGTGTVLRTYNLRDGSQLLLGTTQWLTPKGRLIRKQGIEPDVLVALPVDAETLTPAEAAELSVDALRQSEDKQLLTALEQLGVLAGN